MKNIALCFDRVRDRPGSTDATNAAALVELLRSDDSQVAWSLPDTPGRDRPRFADRQSPLDRARASVAAGYEFLVERWEPGDRIYLFGSGRGASCARALARLLGVVGVLRGSELSGWNAAEFRQYVLGTYAMPRTVRSAEDWRRVGEVAASICGSSDVAVDVAFLGMWDCAAIPGLPRQRTPDPLGNVRAARHALAIDGGWGRFRPETLGAVDGDVQEVWFRGAHGDVAGGSRASAPLADITLDWVLDGAVRAGVRLVPPTQGCGPAPGPIDALAGTVLPVSLRRLPGGAAVHASVETYLRSHPAYWRRLPDHVVWADREWGARAERLVSAPAAPTRSPQLAAAR